MSVYVVAIDTQASRVNATYEDVACVGLCMNCARNGEEEGAPDNERTSNEKRLDWRPLVSRHERE
jgi:hypothetical protein